MAERDGDKAEGAVFDFNDLQALREEYEERIARLTRERDAALDVNKRDAENRIAALKLTHEQQLATDAAARQELIQELTIELAAAREDGELRAQGADKRRSVAETQLAQVRNDVARIESELGRVRQILDVVLATPAPEPVAMQQLPTGLPRSLMTSTPSSTSTSTSTSPIGTDPNKKRKIRLR